jgi:hypothetical protein
MSINVDCKNVKLWKNEHEGRKGTFYTYSVSVSKKMKDGTYKNKSMKVYPKDGLPSDLPNGATCDIEGFLTLDIFQGRDGEVMNPMIYANNIKFHDYDFDDVDGYEQLDADIPF